MHRYLVKAGLILSLALGLPAGTALADRPTLAWDSAGPEVTLLQKRLADWGYFPGPFSGYFGQTTHAAVVDFQTKNGLLVDGVVGPETWIALGLWSEDPATLDLLARLIEAEAGGEPYEGMVGVAAVVLNRTYAPAFPTTIPGVIYDIDAFESVTNGLIWQKAPDVGYQAAADALAGWDPTGEALFFWNPYKPVQPWIWSRPIITQIGNHVFAR